MQVFRIIFGGRYIIIMMGIFSIYTGLIYNDVFSKSINIFGSAYKVNMTEEELTMVPHEMLVPDPRNGHYAQYPYPVGIDPVWQLAENKIPYLNAFKMKISIILGVVHMTFGVVLAIWNHRFVKPRIL